MLQIISLGIATLLPEKRREGPLAARCEQQSFPKSIFLKILRSILPGINRLAEMINE
jgi:hypothetical protein